MIECNDGTFTVSTDPGRAMVTGKCADIGKFKVPSLRGLPARAPYFHNGSADTLMEVVNRVYEHAVDGVRPPASSEFER